MRNAFRQGAEAPLALTQSLFGGPSLGYILTDFKKATDCTIGVAQGRDFDLR